MSAARGVAPNLEVAVCLSLVAGGWGGRGSDGGGGSEGWGG